MWESFQKKIKKPLKSEEARYRITPNEVYLYGEDNITSKMENEVQNSNKNCK